MIGLGTIINVGAVILGGLIGIPAGRHLQERFQKIITTAMGLAVSAMALSGIVAKMLVPTENGFDTAGTYMLIFSLVLGAVTGELIDVDGKMERFGTWLKQKTGSAKDAQFVDGFLDASFTVCIGAMAVVGAITDGLTGDFSILLTKSILDFVILIVLSAAKGKGCIFSAIPVAVLQGFFTLAARLIQPVLTDVAMHNLSLSGSVLILCVGINLLGDGRYRIKVANLLPTIVFAVIAAFIPFLK